ncbi:MAG TPA: LLM class F420-dependent oxidoreductase [Acidimicrobiales bacterium]|nr:LLM class F420-dependent oxidoreductase [Acidimicrobiales bacterium]
MVGSDVVTSMRQRLGRVGTWLGSLQSASADQSRQAARQIEQLGYGSVFSGERIGGKEAFAHQSLLLAATERIVTGTGIANVWSRHAATMQAGADTLEAGYPGRFILGIGISHAPMVDGSGQHYEKPLAHMVHYLDQMDAARAAMTHSEVPAPRILAALRPRMLELARDRADGAHPYFVPPAHTAAAREILGPDKLLIPEQAVVLSTRPDEARAIARTHMKLYLTLPNYVNNLRHLGYGDEDLSAGGSDRLVDAIVAWGDEGAIDRRVQEHISGGADHVVLQPLGDLDSALEQLAALAPTLIPPH